MRVMRGVHGRNGAGEELMRLCHRDELEEVALRAAGLLLAPFAERPGDVLLAPLGMEDNGKSSLEHVGTEA